MKVLSTRERDVEDAAVVLQELSGRIDRSLIDGELRLLAQEIPGHDIAGRYQRVLVGPR